MRDTAPIPSRGPIDLKGTMGHVQGVIAERQRALSDLGLLRVLDGSRSAANVLRIVPRMAFFVMGFQDVLRLTYLRSTDPQIVALAKAHALEDKGHDQWYLKDVERLGSECSVRTLFSDDGAVIRDVAYGQIAEVMKAKHDCTRLAVALSLEAIGAVFFEKTIGFLERIGRAGGLEYFARRHQNIERAHVVFEEDAQRELDAIPVTPDAMVEALAAVHRTFDGMALLADDLERSIRTTEHASGVA
jgi:hypothetical protein